MRTACVCVSAHRLLRAVGPLATLSIPCPPALLALNSFFEKRTRKKLLLLLKARLRLGMAVGVLPRTAKLNLVVAGGVVVRSEPSMANCSLYFLNE